MTHEAAEIAKLAERVEAAAGPDSHLDYMIFHMVSVAQGGVPISGSHNFTVSLDAAMSLIGSSQFWRLGNDGDGPDVEAFKATVTSGDGPALAFAAGAPAHERSGPRRCAASRPQAARDSGHGWAS